MKIIKYHLVLIAFLMFNCEALFHEVTVWNVEKSNSFEYKEYSLIGDHVKYTISHNDKVILEYMDSHIFAKWVTNDSILVISDNPPIKQKVNKINLRVGIDSLRYCPDSLRYTLVHLNRHEMYSGVIFQSEYLNAIHNKQNQEKLYENLKD